MNVPPLATKERQELANHIAMVIRNAMEDFHCQNLSDEQMKQLNPIVRNAVCTALHAFNNYEQAEAAARFVDYHFRMIPHYSQVLGAARIAERLHTDVGSRR